MRGSALAAVALLWIVLLVRIVGLRSFSKMTAFDFVMTVAMGSLVGSAARTTDWTSYVQSLAAMAGLFAIQFATAKLRKLSQAADEALQNRPVLLMRNGRFIEEAPRETRVSRDNVYAKLREANVTAISQVLAVVLETTGDVSVLHGDSLEDEILSGVRTD